jgi:hypothetical protein
MDLSKGEKADLGFGDFFWDFLGFWDFFGILGFSKSQNLNRELRNFHLDFFSYVGLMILRIS